MSSVQGRVCSVFIWREGGREGGRERVESYTLLSFSNWSKKVGTGSFLRVFPQGQVLTPDFGQSPHTPEWHT